MCVTVAQKIHQRIASQSYRDHLVHVALRPGEFCRLFCLEVDDKVEVEPEVVVSFDVLLIRHFLVLKLGALQACREGRGKEGRGGREEGREGGREGGREIGRYKCS